MDQAWAGSGNPRGGPAEPSEQAAIHVLSHRREAGSCFIHSAEAIGRQLCARLGAAGVGPRGPPRQVWGEEHQNISSGCARPLPAPQSRAAVVPGRRVGIKATPFSDYSRPSLT